VADGDCDGDGEGEGDGEADGDCEPDASCDDDGEDEAVGDAGDGDGEAAGDGAGEAGLFVTVQVKLTEPVPPDGFIALTVAAYRPEADGEMVPLISPSALIDRPGGRLAAVKSGDCPAAALSDLTCSWIVVPAAFCWLPGSSSRMAARMK
jgi:hypothetical protein